MLNIDTVKRIHFIGIGGIGMSALARLFLYEGKEVSGSDRSSSQITEALASEGAKIFVPQTKSNITDGIDMVIYTEAMPLDQEEMVAAKALGVPMMNYFSALALVVNDYYLIAVAGTHGKTTTTAMLTDVLEAVDLDPTAIIGSLRAKTGSNFRAGKSKYAVVEACEYKRDFLYLRPEILIITNLELDHVDYYKDLADVQAAFRELALKVPAEGFIITDTSQENIKPILEGVVATIIDYRPFINISLPLKQPGLHNRLNAAAALAAAATVGVGEVPAKSALADFAGTWRRFEYKGSFANESGETKVYDDYAHHPAEIKATIEGARELFKDGYLTVVFQSHTYTRTHELFDNFARALAKADEVILLPIYAAREENISGVSSEKLALAIKEMGAEAKVFQTPEEVVAYIKNNTRSSEVVVTMGAGDMTTLVATGLVQDLKNI